MKARQVKSSPDLSSAVPAVASPKLASRASRLPFLLPGEVLHCTLEDSQGNLLNLTSYKLFCEDPSISIPVATIRRIQTSSWYFTIETIEIRIIKISCDDTSTRNSFLSILGSLAFSTAEMPFAFSDRSSLPFLQVYDPRAEFARLNLSRFDLELTDINIDFSICPTLPQYLCIPRDFPEIANVASFRDKRRIPVCSFPRLWRSAQPLTSLGNRSQADERMLEIIGGGNLLILDLRPQLNAIANQLVSGAGSEIPGNYPGAEVRFCDLHNIHVVRDSFERMWDTIRHNDSLISSHSGWWTALDNTKWYDMVSRLLKTASTVTQEIKIGRSVLVHCSDGWDRTPQVTSLAMLLMDSYYRTREGFAVLIEKEWIAMGHKFHQRMSVGAKDDNDMSPVFIQWLDCVSQIIYQNPSSFAFTDDFLIEIFNAAISARYGNFLFNCEKERIERNVYKRTTSAWSDLLRNDDDTTISDRPIDIKYGAPFMRPWNSFWLRFQPIA